MHAQANPDAQDTAAVSIVTRKELAAHCRLSLRTIDELTRNGSLPFFKIGKSIRYDLVETEAALRERFHVRARASAKHSEK